MFKGSITALVTPFRSGKVDEATFTRFIDWQIAEGTNGLVPVGTTGESPTLDHEEHKRVIELSVKAAKKRVPVIAGTGSNSTDEAVELSQFAEKAGADAVLVVTPYYNKPSQEEAVPGISKPSMTPSAFRSSSTTFRAVRSSTCPSKRWRAAMS